MALSNITAMFQPQVSNEALASAVAAMNRSANAPVIATQVTQYENNRRKEILAELAQQLLGYTTNAPSSMMRSPLSPAAQMIQQGMNKNYQQDIPAMFEPVDAARNAIQQITLQSWNDLSQGNLPQHGVMGLFNGQGFVPDTNVSGMDVLGLKPESFGSYDVAGFNLKPAEFVGGTLDFATDPLTYVSGLGAGKVAGLLPKTLTGSKNLLPKLATGAVHEGSMGAIYGGVDATLQGANPEEAWTQAGLDALMFAGLGTGFRGIGHGIGKVGEIPGVQRFVADETGALDLSPGAWEGPFKPGNVKDNAYKDAFERLNQEAEAAKNQVRGEINDPLYGVAPQLPNAPQPFTDALKRPAPLPNAVGPKNFFPPKDALQGYHPNAPQLGSVRDLPYMKLTPEELQKKFAQQEFALKKATENMKAGKDAKGPIDPEAYNQKLMDHRAEMDKLQAAAKAQGFELKEWTPPQKGKGKTKPQPAPARDNPTPPAGEPIPPGTSQAQAEILNAEPVVKRGSHGQMYYSTRDASRAMRGFFGEDVDTMATLKIAGKDIPNPMPITRDALAGKAGFIEEQLNPVKDIVGNDINIGQRNSALIHRELEQSRTFHKEFDRPLSETEKAQAEAEVRADYATETLPDGTLRNREVNFEWKDDKDLYIFEEYSDIDLRRDLTTYDPITKKETFHQKTYDTIKRAGAEMRARLDAVLEQINAKRAEKYPNAEAEYQKALAEYNEAVRTGEGSEVTSPLRDKVARLSRNRQIPYRQNYSMHFLDNEGISGLWNILESDTSSLPVNLSGLSEDLIPRTKYQPISQRRSGFGRYKEDGLQGYQKYMDMAGDALFLDDAAEAFAKMTTAVEEEASMLGKTMDAGYSNFKAWGEDQTRALTGKRGWIDRGIADKLLGKKGARLLTFFTNRIKRSTILGSFNTLLTQTLNLVGGLTYATEGMVLGFPKAAVDVGKLLFKSKPSAERQMSQFMKYRFTGKVNRIFDQRWLSKPRNVAVWALETMDRATIEFIWRGLYEESVKYIGRDATMEARVKWADMMADRTVGARQKGLQAQIWNNNIVNDILPYQVEVLNQWRILEDMGWQAKSGRQSTAIAGLMTYVLAAHGMNLIIEQITGMTPSLDFFQAFSDSKDIAENPEYSTKEKGKRIAGRVIGEAATGHPLGNIAQSVMGDPYDKVSILGWDTGLTGQELFGRSEYGRFGFNVPVGTVAKDTVSGVANLAEGNTQKGVENLAFAGMALSGIPYTGQMKKMYKSGKDLWQGKHVSSAGNDMYNVAPTASNIIKGSLFGPYAFDEAKAYKGNDMYTRLNELKRLKDENESGKGNPWTVKQQQQYEMLNDANKQIFILRDRLQAAATLEEQQQILEQINTVQTQAMEGTYQTPVETSYGTYPDDTASSIPGDTRILAKTTPAQERESFGIRPDKSDIYADTYKSFKAEDDVNFKQSMRELSDVHDVTAYGLKLSMDYRVQQGELSQTDADAIVKEYYNFSTKEQQRSAATSFMIDAVTEGDEATAKKWAVDAVAADKSMTALETTLQNRAADAEWKADIGQQARAARDAGDFEKEKELLKIRDSMPEKYILAGLSKTISADIYNQSRQLLRDAGADEKGSSKSGYSGSGSSRGTVPLEQVQAILNAPPTTVQDLRNKYQKGGTVKATTPNFRTSDVTSIVNYFTGQDPATVEMLLKRQGVPLTKIAEIINKLKGGGQWLGTEHS